MKVTPVASDSLGVRSMATLVETRDTKIFIDPSAALGPTRYGLPPHPQELQALETSKKSISQKTKNCDILIISHFHYDHYDPDELFYTDKTVFIKNPREHINQSQRGRGCTFEDTVQDTCTLKPCDNSTHTVGGTTLMFSPPFFHGPANIPLGYVIMTTVDDGSFRLLHSSDVQGPVTKEATDYIIRQQPDLLIMDGPPTLFLGWKFSIKNLEDSQNNLLAIMEASMCDVILDHHLLRDLKYRERFPLPYKEHGDRVKTFAEYLGKKNSLLEAYRKHLWGDEKPP